MDFLNFYQSDSLALTPKFQRRTVWRTPQRSYFIDSLLREMPIPTVYLREVQAPDFSRVVREVIDGQQRLGALLDYLSDEFPLARSLPPYPLASRSEPPWSGRYFSELPMDLREHLVNYHFGAEVFVGLSDEDVLQMFARLNTYSVPLNRQELRNGRHFGRFKTACYALALEHLEFWRANRIFSEQSIARMREVELTSELVILTLDGLQDKKSSIDRYYREFDETFPNQEEVEFRFRFVIDELSEILSPEDIRRSNFRRTPIFYSLWAAILHMRFGLDGARLASPERRLSAAGRARARERLLALSDLIDLGREDEEQLTQRDLRFVRACLQQTDNLIPRRIRFETIYRRLVSK